MSKPLLRPNRPPVAVSPTQPVPPVGPSRSSAITDWYAEAQSAAHDVLERQRQAAERHSFAHDSAAPGKPEPPGMFGSRANHRAGVVEGTGERVWVTDHCYFDFDRSLPQRRLAGEFHLKIAACKPPPTGGGSHLFDQFAPDAAKARESSPAR